MDMVWMKHPQLPDDQLICQPEEAAAGHRISGWQETDPPPPDEPIEGPWGALDLDPEPELAPGAKYEAAVESRPENQSAQDGKEN